MSDLGNFLLELVKEILLILGVQRATGRMPDPDPKNRAQMAALGLLRPVVGAPESEDDEKVFFNLRGFLDPGQQKNLSAFIASLTEEEREAFRYRVADSSTKTSLKDAGKALASFASIEGVKEMKESAERDGMLKPLQRTPPAERSAWLKKIKAEVSQRVDEAIRGADQDIQNTGFENRLDASVAYWRKKVDKLKNR